MNLKEFLKETIANGGCSYNLVTGQGTPTTGYMIALQGKEQTYIFDIKNTKSFQYNVANYIKDNTLILMGGIVCSDYFLGSWIHEGELYLDVVVNVGDKDEALFLGKKYGQKAIFDCANKSEILIK